MIYLPIASIEGVRESPRFVYEIVSVKGIWVPRCAGPKRDEVLTLEEVRQKKHGQHSFIKTRNKLRINVFFSTLN